MTAMISVATGCGGAERPRGPSGSAASASTGSASTGSASTGSASTGPSRTAPPGTAAGLPAPGAPIPDDADGAAEALTRTDATAGTAIDAWRSHGDPAHGEPPETVVLPVLYQQRVYRFLARHPGLARRTFAKLRRPLAAQARDNVTATRDLFSLTKPVRSSNVVHTQAPLPAGTLLGHFQRAGRRFGISWQVLAAVMHVESKFGRVTSASSAGAQGPMQFLPATWKAYGLGGDIRDPRDAVMGAAHYLRASGAPRDYERALHAYNPDRRYVDAVLRHARQIRHDPRAFYRYYNWQVFVVTTRGDVRVTGPAAPARD
jgi:hypothetical protein